MSQSDALTQTYSDAAWVLRELLLLTDELNEQGFDTDRTEVFYAAFLALVHKNKKVHTILSLQIEQYFLNPKLSVKKQELKQGLILFYRDRRFVLLPATKKSRAIVAAIAEGLDRAQQAPTIRNNDEQDFSILFRRGKQSVSSSD